MATSSAEPEKLYRYSDVTLSLDSEVKTESAQLATNLENFESTCTEPGFRLSVRHLAGDVIKQAEEWAEKDSWVRWVGTGFLTADAGGFGSGLIQFGRWYPWRSILGREVWLPTVKIGPAPSWLRDMVDTLPWVGGRPAQDPIPVPEQIEPGSLPSQAGLVPPYKPIGEFKLTASFPAYDDGKGHSGIDIKPEPYDPAETYPVHPIAPGVVIKREAEYGVRSDGSSFKRAYGNNVIVRHMRSDGTPVYVRYAHLQELPTIEGIVSTDSVLGNMGSTGRSSGPHLHLEICMNKNFPWRYQYQNFLAKDTIPDSDPPVTYKQDMMKDYVNPLPIIEGHSDWLFQSQVKAE